MTTRVTVIVVVLLAMTAGPGMAQSGVIIDPENPAAGAQDENHAPNTGLIVDPENPGGGAAPTDSATNSQRIFDPENPTSAQGGSGSTDVSSRRSGDPRPQRVVFRGEVTSGLSLDTAHDGRGEDTLESLQQLGMRARVTLGDRWSATVEGRLSWWLTAGPSNERDPVLAVERSRWQGRVEPALRDFYVAGRKGRWAWRIGQQVIAWGSSDIINPANVVNPRDLRYGLLANPDDVTVPVPAIDVSVSLPSVVGQFVVVPVFVPDRMAIYGSDTAVLRPDSPLSAALPVELLAGLVDESLEDVLQPALQQTHLPEEIPTNASVGTRWTWTWRGLDLSGGAFYGFDRQPALQVADPLAAWIATAGEREDLFAVDAATLGLVTAAQSGDPLVDARYERRLDIVADGVRYFGPIGVRFDAVYTPNRTINVDGLTSVRRPRIAGTFGLSYESATGDVVFSIEGFADRTWMRASDADVVLGLDDLVGMAAGLSVDAEAFVGSDAPLAPLEVRIAALTLPREGDVIFAPALGWAFTESSTLSAGVTMFEARTTDDTPVALYRTNDAVFLQFESAF